MKLVRKRTMKVIALILAAVLVLSVADAGALFAYAADDDAKTSVPAEESFELLDLETETEEISLPEDVTSDSESPDVSVQSEEDVPQESSDTAVIPEEKEELTAEPDNQDQSEAESDPVDIIDNETDIADQNEAPAGDEPSADTQLAETENSDAEETGPAPSQEEQSPEALEYKDDPEDVATAEAETPEPDIADPEEIQEESAATEAADLNETDTEEGLEPVNPVSEENIEQVSPVPEEAPAPDAEEPKETSAPVAEESEETSAPDAEESEETSDPDAEEQEAELEIQYPALEQSAVTGGVIISVSAEEGTFPEGARLVVERVPASRELQAEAAVAERRSSEQNVAVSYTFDIRIEDAEGNELQPAEGKTVKVSFALAEAADSNLKANVYHITEGGDQLVAEKLNAEVDGSTETITAETDGFSLYTVEFTYKGLQYVMEGATELPLSVILSVIGLSGTPSAVQTSNASLVSAYVKNGEWIVSSHAAFSSTEWMNVTIDDVVYEITITDAITSWVGLQTALSAGGTVTLSQDIIAGTEDANLTIPAGITVTLDLKGYTINRNCSGISRTGSRIISLSGTLTLKDSSTTKTGKLTGSKGMDNRGAGIYVAPGGKLEMQGGSITGNESYGAKGGGVYVDNTGTFIMKDGSISNNEAANFSGQGGGVYVANGGIFTMNGGSISSNVATSGAGGGVFVNDGGKFSMGGGSVSNNRASSWGGGIYLAIGSMFEIKGSVNISGNTVSSVSNNLYLNDGQKITVAGTLSNTTPIGITVGGSVPYVFTTSLNGNGNVSKFSSDNNSYYISQSGTEAAVSQRIEVTVSGITASNKVYDGTTAANLNTGNVTFTGKQSGDSLTVTATGTFATKTVGNGKTVTISGLTLGGASANKYILSSGSQSSTTANITKKNVTVSGITAANKTYNGTTVATLVYTGATLSGKIEGDYLNVSATGTFTNANVGNSKTVTISGLTLGGSSSGNYQLASSGQQTSTTANITKKNVTVSGITASNKVYDGNTSATLVTTNASFSGKLSSDTLTISATGTFTNANVGNSKTVTISGLTLGGSSAGNYQLKNSGQQTSTTANITKKNVTVSGITASNKVYDGNTSATLVTTNASFSGKLSSDTLTISATGTFTNANVESNKTVTISNLSLGGTSSGNYQLASSGHQTSTTANITKKNVTVSGITAGNKVYDGNTSATLDCTGAVFAGIVTGDSLTVTATGTFDNANVGTGKTVTISGLTIGGTSAANYAVDPASQSATTADITRKSITISGITAENKIYDGNTTATLETTGASFAGIVGSDSLSVTADGAFDSKDVGSGKTVTISNLVLGGADAGNYDLAASSQQTTTTADITRKSITVSGITASNKIYDGNTTATLVYTGAVFTGIVTGDTLTVSATGTFDNKDVGTGKNISLSDLALGGSSIDNYQLAASGQQTSTTADITQKSITVSGITAGSKEYDDTTTATLDTSAAVFTGIESGDALTVSATGTFDNKNAGTGKTVTISGLTLGGTSAANYALAGSGNQTATTADITPAPLTITADPKSKTYGDADPALTYTATGFKGSDSIAIMTGALSRASGEDFGIYGIIRDTLSAGDNYTITYNGANLTISKAPLTVTADAKSKTYGDADPDLTYTASGFKGSDTEASVMTGALARDAGQDAGSYGITLGTLSAGANYDISYTGANLTIGKAALAVTANSHAITYGDAPANGGVTYSGFVSGEDESILGGTLAYAYDYAQYGDVGSYTITPSGLTSGNYEITFNTGTLTVIQKEAALSWTGLSFIYDGTGHLPAAAVTNLETGDDCAVTVIGAATSVGNYTATATALSNGNYKLPAAVTQNFDINRRTVVVSGITAADKVYDGNAAATLDYTGVVFGGDGLLSGEDLTITATGTFDTKNAASGKTVNITALTLGGADAGNYVLAAAGNQTSTTADITPKEIGLSWDNLTFTYDGASHAPTATATGLIAGDTCLVSISAASAKVNAGTYTAAAESLSNGNYKLPADNAVSFTINPAEITVSGITVNNKVYDGNTAAALDYSGAAFAGIVTGDKLSVTATGNFSDADAADGKTVAISGLALGGASAANYVLAAAGQQAAATADITKAPLTVTTSSASKVYDGSALTAAGSIIGLVAGETATLVPTGSQTDAASSSNTYSISWDGTAKEDNYEIISQTLGTLTVTPAPLTVVTPDAQKVYDGTPLTASGSISGFVGSESATLVALGSQTDVGGSTNTYAINWDGTAKAGNYAVTSETLGTLMVTQYADEIMVVTTGGSFVYDGNAHGAVVSVSALPAGYILISASSSASVTDVTASPVPATADELVIHNAAGDDVTAQLTITKVDGTITITPAPLTVTTPDASKVYDGAPLTSAGSLVGLIGSETATFTTTGSQTAAGNSVNTYSITWDGTAKAGNYSVTGETLGTLTVTEYGGAIVVTTTGGTFVYDGKPHGAVVSVSALPAGYSLDTAYSSASATDVTASPVPATADILVIRNAAGVDVTDKLTIKKVDGTITITPAPLTITTPDAKKVYDEKPLTASGTIKGLANGETATLVATGSQTDVGSSPNTYDISWDGTAKASNYKVVSASIGTLTVTEVEYPCVEGSDATYTTGKWVNMRFRFKRNVKDEDTFGHFTGVKVDGKLVDPQYYEASPGSVIIDLKPAFLYSLMPGDHTLQALFDDVDSPVVHFTIVRGASAPSDEPPQTGDGNEILWCAAVIAVCAMGMIMARKKRRSK